MTSLRLVPHLPVPLAPYASVHFPHSCSARLGSVKAGRDDPRKQAVLALTDQVSENDPIRVDIRRILQIQREIKRARGMACKVDIFERAGAKVGVCAGVCHVGCDFFKIDVEPVGISDAAGVSWYWMRRP